MLLGVADFTCGDDIHGLYIITLEPQVLKEETWADNAVSSHE